jgi:hypothetical protein
VQENNICINQQANHELIYKQAFRHSHHGPCGKLLVVRVPLQRLMGSLERADAAGPVGRPCGPPRTLAHPLVEQPEVPSTPPSSPGRT